MKPNGNGNLAQAELDFADTLLAGCPQTFPPHVALVVRYAPASFDDKRYGHVVALVRNLVASGVPAEKRSVQRALPNYSRLDPDERQAIEDYLDEREHSPISVQLLEHDAQTIWEAFRRRRITEVYSEAQRSMESDPSKADQIVNDVRGQIDDLGPGDATSDLDQRLFAADRRPPPPEARYCLSGICICTPGNLTSITALPKQGKSAFVGAMVGAVLTPRSDLADCLGVTSDNRESRALLHFDTEQSPADHWALVDRTLRRAMLTEAPPWLRSYSLVGLSAPEIRRAVKTALERDSKLFGGIHSAIIDGVGDLALDVNDAAESAELVSSLRALSVEHCCPIIGVLHFNPGSEKSRGHLGSELERRAESNLRLDKSDEAVTVWSDKNRGAPIPKHHGPRFAWSVEKAMHVSIESESAAINKTNRRELEHLAESIFRDRLAMTRTELETTFKKRLKVHESTAYRRVRDMIDLTVIKKSVAGLYEIARPADTKHA